MSRLTQLKQESEWRHCRRSFAYWASNYAYIRHPRRGRILAELRPAQVETIAEVERGDDVIILKARQIGYSTLFALYQLWLCMFFSDKYVVDLSIGEREAVKLLAKSKYAWKYLPDWMRARVPLRVDTLQKMEFENDSLIESLPSKKDPARGESVSLVIVDEWASFESPEDAWASIEPIADVGGQIVGLSTAKGWGNFFHEMWVRAKTGRAQFRPLFFPWSANTDRDDDWYAEKARNNPEWFMAQEYPRNEDEAFLKSGNPVFNLDLLAAIQTQDPIEGHLSRSGGTMSFVAQPHDDVRVWEMPDPMDGYVIGADVAEGLEHGDYSSAHVISCRTGLVVATWHGHIEADLFGERLYDLGQWYNTALIGVEVNNHGLSTLHALRRLQYPRIYYRTTLNLKTNRQTNEMGWRTTKNTKGLMIDDLGAAIRESDLSVWDQYTIAEMKTYVRDEKGGMAGSPHDDRVISLAIANQMRRYAKAPEYSTWAGYDYMSGGWWEQQLHQQRQPKGAGLIGAGSTRR